MSGWDFQAKSGSSGSCRLFLRFLGKIAVPKVSGKAPGSPRHPLRAHQNNHKGGTSLDTCQICIQARFDTYQIPFFDIENTEKGP